MMAEGREWSENEKVLFGYAEGFKWTNQLAAGK